MFPLIKVYSQEPPGRKGRLVSWGGPACTSSTGPDLTVEGIRPPSLDTGMSLRGQSYHWPPPLAQPEEPGLCGSREAGPTGVSPWRGPQQKGPVSLLSALGRRSSPGLRVLAGEARPLYDPRAQAGSGFCPGFWNLSSKPELGQASGKCAEKPTYFQPHVDFF